MEVLAAASTARQDRMDDEGLLRAQGRMPTVATSLHAAGVDKERVKDNTWESEMAQEELRREREKQGKGEGSSKARDEEVRSEPANPAGRPLTE